MFRCKYASEEIKTYVELEFIYQNKKYYIKRNPEYMRKSKKGEGQTKQVAEVELHLPEGSIITKNKEVNEKVKEIIGIDKNQFLQIAMIPQGEFLKLLYLSTEERQVVFREIFKTRILSNIAK